MGKKHKHPEHINLERWLISYADFITLLFATFVVLYALSQVDVNDFKALEDSIQNAFAAPSIMQGSDGMLQQSSSNKLFDTSTADAMIAPLMMEYLSQKYEDDSMNQIEKEINNGLRYGKIEGAEAFRTDKGIVIRLSDDYLFKSGSAELTPGAKIKLDKIGAIIGNKFYMHNIRVEGNTDNQKIKSSLYPSNWELSSARSSAIIRYFISRFQFLPSLFTAIGYADTRPIGNNASESGRAKNRRVELLILKNKFNSIENPQNAVTKMSKDAQEKMQKERMEIINRIDSIAAAAKNMDMPDRAETEKAIIINQVYDKEVKRLSHETNALDTRDKSKVTGQGDWLKPPANSK